MEEVVALEDPVHLDHPVIRLGHERLEDGGGDVGVVVGSERVADVVQQRADDVLLVASVPESPRRRLEGLREPRSGNVFANGAKCDTMTFQSSPVLSSMVVKRARVSAPTSVFIVASPSKSGES